MGVVTSLTFSSSVTQLAVDIPINDDLFVEVNERFQVSLATGDGAINLNPATGFVTIIDNDGKYGCLISIQYYMQVITYIVQ